MFYSWGSKVKMWTLLCGWRQGLIDSFGEEGMQLPISIMQMRLRSSKNSNSTLYSPGNQQLRLRLDLKMGGVSP